jgi:sorting nexin-25
VLEIAELSSQTGPLSPQDVKRGKRAVFEAQKAVYDQMDDEDWPAFQKSELYLKAVADLKNNTAPRVNRAARASSHSPLGTPTTQTASLMLPGAA